MTTGKLILITGPAAVGKSTITKGLQTRLTTNGELWLAIELDAFGRALPRRWISWGQHQGRYAERGFTYTRTTSETIELALGADGRRVLASFHRSVAAVVKSGVNVICETIVYDHDDWSDWAEALGDIVARWVKLIAPLATLEAREAARSPLSQGLARGMVVREPVGRYDIEIDTSIESTDVVVSRVIASAPL